MPLRSPTTDQTADNAIARRLAQSGARVIGFLPADGGAEDQTALLRDLAASLVNFVSGPVGVIGRWRSWTGQAGGGPTADPRGPRVVEVTPPSCVNSAAASSALEEAIAVHTTDFSRVLVDLSDYAPPGQLPGAAEFAEQIVVLVRARRTRLHRVEQLHRLVPSNKSVAAILVG